MSTQPDIAKVLRDHCYPDNPDDWALRGAQEIEKLRRELAAFADALGVTKDQPPDSRVVLAMVALQDLRADNARLREHILLIRSKAIQITKEWIWESERNMARQFVALCNSAFAKKEKT